MEDILGFNSFSGALVVGNRCAGVWRGSAKRTVECQNDKISTKDYYCTGGKFNIMVTLVCTPILSVMFIYSPGWLFTQVFKAFLTFN